jgi:5-methyltetrahydrofolate--homocysteine methyltransferase
MEDILQEIGSNLYNGEVNKVSNLVQDALKSGLTPNKILSEGLIAGMDKVGKDFKAGILYVPEVLRTASAMVAGMEILRPLLTQADGGFTTDKCIIGTVKGDLHDIGKNLVKMMLEGAGFEVIDLGTDVSPNAFVAAAQQYQPKIVAMSALLTTTMSNMRATIDALSSSGIRID